MNRFIAWVFAMTPISVTATTAALGPFRLEVPARGFEEHCIRLNAGEQVRYRYSATAEVDFNIHYHRGKDVFYPVKSSGSRSADATFTAPQADAYCMMWERSGEGAVRIEGVVEPAGR